MAGIIVDTIRMHRTKKDWSDLIGILSEIIGQPITEIHTRDFYQGNGKWYGKISGEDRAKIIDAIFNWLKERKHNIVYAAVDKKKFNAEFHNDTPYCNDVKSLWCFMALHICLAIQKSQSSKGFKGHTMLIFDNAKTEQANFIELFNNPPIWTDSYYSRKKKQKRLDHIIDAPYFTDSKYVGLIQVADWICFFLRRFIELQKNAKPNYDDEQDNIAFWGDILLSESIPTSAIYPLTGRCECAKLFCRYAPECLQRKQ